jgi:hypothetical protein
LLGISDVLNKPEENLGYLSFKYCGKAVKKTPSLTKDIASECLLPLSAAAIIFMCCKCTTIYIPNNGYAYEK